jgi:hypothetical protein
MSTMNFSVPEDVKERFNRVFAGRNKSAVVTRLLEEAIAQAERQQASDAAIERILARRRAAPPTSAEEVRRIRDELRADTPPAA